MTEKLTVLFKGKSGTGKTATSLTFPDPILYLKCDPGAATLRKAAASRSIIVEPINSWQDYGVIRKRWWAGTRQPLADAGVQTIVLDTWSFFTQIIVTSLGGADGTLKMQDWGLLLNRQKETLMELVLLALPEGEHPGCNVVVNCHTKENVSEDGIIQSVGLAIQGQFKDSMEAYFDYVLVTGTETRSVVQGGKRLPDEQKFLIHASPPRHQTTKGGDLPSVIEVAKGQGAFGLLNQTWKL